MFMFFVFLVLQYQDSSPFSSYLTLRIYSLTWFCSLTIWIPTYFQYPSLKKSQNKKHWQGSRGIVAIGKGKHISIKKMAIVYSTQQLLLLLLQCKTASSFLGFVRELRVKSWGRRVWVLNTVKLKGVYVSID